MNLSPDAGLARAIEAYKAALPPGELLAFDLSAADRLGVPVQSATFFDPSGRMRGGIGYGPTPEQALTGALGEMTEEFCASRWMQSQTLQHGSYQEMVRQRGERGVADPLTLCLEAGSGYTPQMPLSWAEVERYPSREKVLVPAEWVACYAGDGASDRPLLITPITNGLGAGVSFEQALCHGLLELLQRDGNSVRIRALASTTAIDPATISDPASRALLAHLDAQGVDACVKVASTEGGLPNVYAVGADREPVPGAPPIMAAGGGEACHPVAAVAVRKALLELCSSRARIAFCHGPLALAERVAPPGYLDRILPGLNPASEEPRALESLLEWLRMPLSEIKSLLGRRVLRVDESVPLSSLPTQDEAAMSDKNTLLKCVLDGLHAQGLEVLVADFSPSQGGVHAVKAIVPGLEVETMSYARVGERNVRRLIEAASRGEGPLAGIGAAPSGACEVRLTREAQERLGGTAWLDVEGIERVVGPLYSLYREPGRHVAPFVLERGGWSISQ